MGVGEISQCRIKEQRKKRKIIPITASEYIALVKKVNNARNVTYNIAKIIFNVTYNIAKIIFRV